MINIESISSRLLVSRGKSIGLRLVQDMKSDALAYDVFISDNCARYDEQLEHRGFYEFLESDFGQRLLREIMRPSERYQFE